MVNEKGTMLTNLKKKTRYLAGRSPKDNKGFTIIEVMIVLVIAAVIILIVFLAVPALQRNSRNTQRKKDASRLQIAAQEWRASNANAMPGYCIPNFFCSPTAATQRTGVLDNAGVFSFYDQTKVWVVPTTTTTDLTTASGGNWDTQKSGDTPFVWTNAQCSNQGKTLAVGTEAVVVYTVEQSNGTKQLTCV